MPARTLDLLKEGIALREECERLRLCAVLNVFVERERHFGHAEAGRASTRTRGSCAQLDVHRARPKGGAGREARLRMRHRGGGLVALCLGQQRPTAPALLLLAPGESERGQQGNSAEGAAQRSQDDRRAVCHADRRVDGEWRERWWC